VNLAVRSTAVVFLRVKRKKVRAVFLGKTEVAKFTASIWERNFNLSFQYAFMKKLFTKNLENHTRIAFICFWRFKQKNRHPASNTQVGQLVIFGIQAASI
jgi:hypothetical protein